MRYVNQVRLMHIYGYLQYTKRNFGDCRREWIYELQNYLTECFMRYTEFPEMCEKEVEILS